MAAEDSNDLDALLDRGARLYSAGRTTAAAAVYRKALEQAPDDPTVRFRHAMALWHGEHRAEEALSELLSLAESHPGNAPVHLAAAQVFNSLGRRGEAAQSAEAALLADPATSSAWHELALAHDPADGDALRARLEEALSRDGLEDRARRTLHLALARVLARAGDDRGAFAEHLRANRLATRRWSPDGDRAVADRLAAIVTPNLLARCADDGHPDDRLIFVIGMPRSGTSLLERMLSAHPDVVGVGETTAIGDVWRALNEQIGSDTPPEAFAQALDRRMLESAGGSISMPSHPGSTMRKPGASSTRCRRITCSRR